MESVSNNKRHDRVLAVLAHLHYSPLSCVRASRHFIVTAGTEDSRMTLWRLIWHENLLTVEFVALLQVRNLKSSPPDTIESSQNNPPETLTSRVVCGR